MIPVLIRCVLAKCLKRWKYPFVTAVMACVLSTLQLSHNLSHTKHSNKHRNKPWTSNASCLNPDEGLIVSVPAIEVEIDVSTEGFPNTREN